MVDLLIQTFSLLFKEGTGRLRLEPRPLNHATAYLLIDGNGLMQLVDGYQLICDQARAIPHQ